jgi:hypothetical protein
MNIYPLRSRLQLYPHEVYFTTNNLTFNNIYAFLGFNTRPSTEPSLFNSYIMPSIPLLDTYQLYWTDELESQYSFGIPNNFIICELTCNTQGKIISLYTEEQVRGMGIGTYMLQHVKTKYQSLSASLPPMYQSLSNWFSRQGVTLS